MEMIEIGRRPFLKSAGIAAGAEALVGLRPARAATRNATAPENAPARGQGTSLQ